MRLLPLSNGEYAKVSDEDFFACLGKMPWHMDSHGYAQCKEGRHPDRTTLLLHHFIGRRLMGLIGEIDHKERIPLDCQRTNLREATRSEGNRNRGVFKNSKTGITGIILTRSNTYEARISVNKKAKSLGTFATIKQAIAVRKAAELEHYGEFLP